MDLEALLVIGTVTVAVGAVLFLVSRLGVKWWLRKHVADPKLADRRTIHAVIIFVIIWVGGMLPVVAAPESMLAKLMQSGPAVVVWTFLSSVVGWGIAGVIHRSRAPGVKVNGDV